MECAINEFRNKCSAFLESKEGREACTGRFAWIVKAEKLRSSIFAECIHHAMADAQRNIDIRLAVECDGLLLPVIYAKIVDTAKAIIPYIYRKQRWNPFKKHEPVLALLSSPNISDIDYAMKLSELEKVYEAGGHKPFSRSIPWIGVGVSDRPGSDSDRPLYLNLAYKVETVGYDAGSSRIVVKAIDRREDFIFSRSV